jgi:hypothetical protein
MGLLVDIAGAITAVELAKKADPNAGLLTEGIAAIVGFEGIKKLTEHQTEPTEPAANPDQPA